MTLEKRRNIKINLISRHKDLNFQYDRKRGRREHSFDLADIFDNSEKQGTVFERSVIYLKVE